MANMANMAGMIDIEHFKRALGSRTKDDDITGEYIMESLGFKLSTDGTKFEIAELGRNLVNYFNSHQVMFNYMIFRNTFIRRPDNISDIVEMLDQASCTLIYGYVQDDEYEDHQYHWDVNVSISISRALEAYLYRTGRTFYEDWGDVLGRDGQLRYQ